MKYNLRYIFLSPLLVLFLGFGNQSFGQQDAQYSQYMFNQLAYNPAYAGSRGVVSGVLLLRRQWLGLDGSPTTGTFSLHAPSRNLRHGFGLGFIHDRIGVTRQNHLTGNYAYRIPVGANHLALGLSGGINHFANMYSQLTPLEVDQLNPGTNQAVVLPRLGTGAYFHSERFFLGVSVPNLLSSYYKFKDPMLADVAAQEKNHYFGTIGGAIPLGSKLDFRPSVVAKFVENTPFQMDLNAALFYDQKLWVGVGYRTGDAVVGMIELVFSNGMRLGYGYDYTLSRLTEVNSGSHELMLGFDLKQFSGKVITPRYF